MDQLPRSSVANGAERAARIAERRALRGLPPVLDLGIGMRSILTQPWITEALHQQVLVAYAEVVALLEANKVNGRAYGRWRRLLVRAATPPGVRINRLEIGERDHWRCGFCSGTVLRSTSPGLAHSLSASLDHVKPLAAGGLHTPENVRLAHYACNAAGMALSAARRRRRAGDRELFTQSAPGSANRLK